jgi:hypothetical protein
MSAVLMPLVAAGGIYLAVDAFFRKTRKNKPSTSSLKDSSESGKESEENPNTTTQTAPIKSKKRHRSLANKKPEDLFSLIEGYHQSKDSEKKTTRKLFVFYSFGEKNKDWDYKNLPETWQMKRRVLNVNRSTNYTNVDVFIGERKTLEKMREYLENAFSQLKDNDIVKEYKIRGINTHI